MQRGIRIQNLVGVCNLLMKYNKLANTLIGALKSQVNRLR